MKASPRRLSMAILLIPLGLLAAILTATAREDRALAPSDSADLEAGLVTASDAVSLISNFTYTVTVQNHWPAAATGVVISNFLPANVSFVSSSPSQGSCALMAGLVVCQLGSLANGGSATVVITTQPTAAGLT